MCQMDNIPEWLLRPSQKIDEVKNTRLNFLRRTILHFGRVFSNEIYLAQQAQLSGFLQRIDPRAKLLIILGFILFTNFTHNWLVLFLLFFISLGYAFLSKLNIRTFLVRVWGYIPLVVLLFSLPGMFNLFSPGRAILTVIAAQPSGLFHNGLSLTTTGVAVVGKLFVRSGITLGFAYLLIMTTPWLEISHALSRFKFLRGFVQIIDMCYRYLFLLAILAVQMIEARFLRSVGHISHRDNRRYLGHSLALLFIKAGFLSEEIYAAMRLRGYSNKFVSIKILKFSIADSVFLINNGIILFVLLFLNRI